MYLFVIFVGVLEVLFKLVLFLCGFGAVFDEACVLPEVLGCFILSVFFDMFIKFRKVVEGCVA